MNEHLPHSTRSSTRQRALQGHTPAMEFGGRAARTNVDPLCRRYWHYEPSELPKVEPYRSGKNASLHKEQSACMRLGLCTNVGASFMDSQPGEPKTQVVSAIFRQGDKQIWRNGVEVASELGGCGASATPSMSLGTTSSSIDGGLKAPPGEAPSSVLLTSSPAWQGRVPPDLGGGTRAGARGGSWKRSNRYLGRC